MCSFIKVVQLANGMSFGARSLEKSVLYVGDGDGVTLL